MTAAPVQVARYLYLVTLMPAASAVGGVFPNRAEIEALARFAQEPACEKSQDDGKIDHEAERGKNAHVREEGQCRTVGAALVAATEIWPTPPAIVFIAPPKKFCDARAENG